jgi:hypothetical protein
MVFSTSDIIAGIALIVSFFGLIVSILSAFYARSQSQYASIDAQNSYRAQLADAHRYYYAQVIEIEEKHADELKCLMNLASDALREIVVLTGSYDCTDGTHPYMRHLLHEASEMIFIAFKGQMGWQTGLNLLHRAHAFKTFEADEELAKDAGESVDFRNATRTAYFANRNRWQEQDLLGEGHFHRLALSFSKRLRNDASRELAERVDKILIPIREKHASIRDSVLQSSELLERLLREGEMAHFSLRESPQIFDRLSHRRATLNTLSYFTVQADSAVTDAAKYLYICFVLHAFAEFSSWGWKHRDLR